MARTRTKPNINPEKFREKFDATYGTDLISRPDPKTHKYEVIPSGSMTLDYALGCGGFIRGRVVQFWGVESIGKSTMALLAVASAQRTIRDRKCLWIDIEETYDPKWAEALGVDTDRLDIAQVNDAEETADITMDLVDSGQYSLVVLDSVGAMVSRKEKEKKAEEATVAAVPRILTRLLKQSVSLMRETATAMIIINQVRANIGGYGRDTTTGGGWMLKHVTTHSLEFKRTSNPAIMIGTKPNTVQVGHELAILIEKNKVAPPKRTAQLWLYNATTGGYTIGVDRVSEAWELGRTLGIIEQRGSVYDLPDGSKSVKGQDGVKTKLAADPSLVSLIRRKALAATASVVVTSPQEEG